MTAQLLQFGASLGAVLALAWVAKRLGLGGEPELRDAEHARELADEAVYGFDACDVALDRARRGALLADVDGRVILLRRHGSQWAGRLLDRQARVAVEGGLLTIATAERTFGAVTFDLGDAAALWAERLKALR